MVQIHDRDRRHSSDAEQTKTQTNGPLRHASVPAGRPVRVDGEPGRVITRCITRSNVGARRYHPDHAR